MLIIVHFKRLTLFSKLDFFFEDVPGESHDPPPSSTLLSRQHKVRAEQRADTWSSFR